MRQWPLHRDSLHFKEARNIWLRHAAVVGVCIISSGPGGFPFLSELINLETSTSDISMGFELLEVCQTYCDFPKLQPEEIV